MRVLFVCRGNVGRSQMAAALFHKYFGEDAFSAGTKVFEKQGQKLKEIPLAEPVIRFMKKEDIDISENARTQLTHAMLKGFDKIIVMAEQETIPKYLLKMSVGFKAPAFRQRTFESENLRLEVRSVKAPTFRWEISCQSNPGTKCNEVSMVARATQERTEGE